MFDALVKSNKHLHQPYLTNDKKSLDRPLFSVFGLLLILFLLFNNTVVVAAEIAVKAARVGQTADYTRITLESSQPLQYELITLNNPDRVVIDLENVALTSTLQRLPTKLHANDPLIEKIRLGRFKPHVLRIVLDLKSQVIPRAFTLEPTNQSDHRFVLNISRPDKAAKKDDLDRLVASLYQKETTPSTQNIPTPQVKSLQAAQIRKPSAPRFITIAIDAGHGGKDPGAIGNRGTYEKTITLAIAKKLKTRIDKEPYMRAMLTRTGDYYLTLAQRRAKARSANADLFVSIHADGSEKKHPRGSSVYTLSERGATSTTARWLAKKENSVDRDLMGGVDITTKSTDIKEVLLDLSLSATINDSVRLAEHVLKEIGNINRLHKKNVEQAGFDVLKSPDIPSILVETAFLTNPHEERKLTDQSYQNKMADALFSGIKQYFSANPALTRTEVAHVR